jgi:hypothetical protein
MWKGNLAWG